MFVSHIFAQQLVTDHSLQSNIRFFAKATFGNFEGTTDAVYGTIYLNNDNLVPKDSLNFYVYLDSIDTGIGLRNSHMREKYLETYKYPIAKFRGNVVSADSISTLESSVFVNGFFLLHGVKRTMLINGKFFKYGRVYKIISSFNIKLSDYEIEQPSFLFNKVENNILVDMIIYLKRKNLN